MSRTDELTAIATAWNDAWNSRDASKLAAFFAPDSTYYEPELDAPVAGKAGIVEAAEKTWEQWPECSFKAVSITIQDPRVVLEWRSSARHRSGKHVNLEGIDVLEMNGDQISAARVYYDVHSRNVALEDG